MSKQTRLNRGDTARGYILCLTLILSALAYSFRLTSFLHAKEGVLVIGLTAIAVLALSCGGLSGQGFRAFAPLWALLGLSALLHLAAFPCRVRADAVEELVRWTVLLLLGAYAFETLQSEAWRRRVRATIGMTAVAASVLGLLQYAGLAAFLFPVFGERSQRVYSVFGNQDLFGGYLAMAVPILVYQSLTLARKPARLALFGLVVVVPGLLISGSRSAWLAAFTGILVVLPFAKASRPRIITLVAAVGVVSLCTLFIAPAATFHRIPATFAPPDVGGRARLWFWDGTLRMMCAHPFLGVGPGNYAYWSPLYLGEALQAPGGEGHYHNTVHTLHAHSEPLEFVAETGLPGIVCGLWMLVRLLRRRGMEWGPLASLGVFSLFNAGLHSAPHALAGVLLAAMLLARREPARGESPASVEKASWLPRLAAFPAVALAVFVLYGVVWPSYQLRKAEWLHLSGEPPFDAYERVVGHPWPNAAAHEKYGIALFEAGDYSAAEQQLLRALEGLDTGGVHLLLGIIAARQGDETSAREHLEQCLFRWPSNERAWTTLLECTPPRERDALLERAREWLPQDAFERLSGRFSMPMKNISNGGMRNTVKMVDRASPPITTLPNPR